MPSDQSVVLGFDFGAKRIGVAVGQRITQSAQPLQVIALRGGAIEWRAIERCVSEWRPGALVVGVPLTADGVEDELTRRCRRFARQLAGRFQLPVHTIDERLSSVEARERSGGRREIDDYAAAVILESWLLEGAPE